MDIEVLADYTLTRQELVQQSLGEVYQEYQTWDAMAFEETIKSLERDSSGALKATETLEDFRLSPTTQFGVVEAEHQEVVEIMDAHEDSSLVPIISKCLGPTLELGGISQPHPPYDSTTPLLRSLYHGDDSSTMPFIPLSDDSSFGAPTIFHLVEHFDDFAWQRTNDPSVKAIVLEAVCRLMERHQLSINDIEQTGVVPCSLDFVMDWYRMRDFPGCFTQLSERFNPPIYTNFECVNNLAKYFCNNPNCNHIFCPTHINNSTVPQGLTRQYKSRDFFEDDLRPSEPCDAECYLYLKKGKIQDLPAPEWCEADSKLFELVMKSEPDGLPCDLATILRKPCHEVFAQRAIMFPDPPLGTSPLFRMHKTRRGGRTQQMNQAGSRDESTLTNGQWDSKSLPSQTDLGFVTVATQFTAPEPCNHPGPCDKSSNCGCWKNSLRCEKKCLCNSSCIRRHKGCNCLLLVPAKLCGTDECECYAERRECDYELCRKCGAGSEGQPPCCNVSIQRNKRKKVDVRATAHGLGLFVLQRAQVGEFVTEYIGEIINDPTVESRSDVSKHTGRNYVMTLSKHTLLDGGPAGGEARYINHSSSVANVRAEVFYVNGEHRIGLFATQNIQPQQELLLDYGEDFFEEHMISVSGVHHGDLSEGSQENEGKYTEISLRKEGKGRIISANATASPEKLRISTTTTVKRLAKKRPRATSSRQ